jgi:hypothetical protein
MCSEREETERSASVKNFVQPRFFSLVVIALIATVIRVSKIKLLSALHHTLRRRCNSGCRAVQQFV